jgi:NitT/TauT family transport system permease protein
VSAVVTRRRIAMLIPPIVVGAAVLALWEWWIVARDVKPYLMPKPTAIREQLSLQRHLIWNAAWMTGKNALIGLIVGTIAGVVMALIASRLRFFRDMITPVAAAINVLPLIAVTPILYNAISNTSQTPRRVVVSLVVFFPIFINVMKGLTQIDATQAELMRSYAASPRDVLRRVRVPNALPFFFTGFKTAASGAVISAVVAEYFGGPQKGLGYYISSNAAQTRTPQAWAYVVAACLLGLAFFLISLVLERLAMPWRARRDAAAP